MNPACCFLQTLLGLVSYTNGLRDSGFEALNTFRCTSSIDHIRTHGTFWAEKRNAIDEIDKKSFWRISFDNLNLRKFSKKLTEGGGAKRMLCFQYGNIAIII